MNLRIHAICVALNESHFITELLKSLYPFCSGISILSQYDRDWYGRSVIPDDTVSKVLGFPDPEGKVHLVVRRWKDEAAARNHELFALGNNSFTRRIQSHGVPKPEILRFHEKPDYFLIVDADEIYDANSFGNIVDYLGAKKPRGMRVTGYNYVRTWNRRIPSEVMHFKQFGFLRPGLFFEMQRVVDWNESRLRKLLTMLRLPDFSSNIYGFIDCPQDVGVFHHGCWLGDDARLHSKRGKSSHKDWKDLWFGTDYISEIDALQTVYVPTEKLPRNIRDGSWPESFLEPHAHFSEAYR